MDEVAAASAGGQCRWSASHLSLHHHLPAALFLETGFLCVALAVLELRGPPVSASRVLGLKTCATTAKLDTG